MLPFVVLQVVVYVVPLVLVMGGQGELGGFKLVVGQQALSCDKGLGWVKVFNVFSVVGHPLVGRIDDEVLVVGVGLGLVVAVLVGENQGVLVLCVFKVVVDAVFAHQTGDKVIVGFAILGLVVEDWVVV